MIYGIGTDILSIDRIDRLYQKYGQTLAQRLLSEQEQQEWQNCQTPERFLAKRFAAKEAFAKAVGTGIRGEVSFINITINHNQLGKPEFMYTQNLQNWLMQQGIGKVHLSLSDEINQVVAFAVAESIGL